MRVFLALELAAEARAEASALAARLRPQLGGGAVRWLDPSDYHVTLVFLARFDPAQLAALEVIARNVARAHAPLALATGGVGAFPDFAAARILWTNVTGDLAALAMLQDQLAAAVVPLGVPRETRPYVPHVTLARCSEVPVHLAEPELKVTAFRATEVALYESRTAVEIGARYRVLVRWRLGR